MWLRFGPSIYGATDRDSSLFSAISDPDRIVRHAFHPPRRSIRVIFGKGIMSKVKEITNNRKARFEYHIFDTFEAGLSLVGSEVKSLREGRVSLAEAFVVLRPTGAWLRQAHIAQYKWANINNHDPLRERQLLLHKHELVKIRRSVREKGMTIVPLRMYFKASRIKIEIALAKGKKLHDKREAIKARESKREIARSRR
jgi:SsrA-binding protein